MPKRPQKRQKANGLAVPHADVVDLMQRVVTQGALDDVLLMVESTGVTLMGKDKTQMFRNTWTWDEMDKDLKEAGHSISTLLLAVLHVNMSAILKQKPNDVQNSTLEDQPPNEGQHNDVSPDTGGSPPDGEPTEETVAGDRDTDTPVHPGDEES